MRRAFTLVELLVVTLVLVTLMSIAFRLAGSGADAEARSITVSKMQRIENAISGYYAAFGSYPPVKIHGSRNFFLKVNNTGIQQNGNEDTSELVWARVEAACRSQPFGCNFPYPRDMQEYVKGVSEALTELHNTDPDSSYGKNPDLEKLFDGLYDPSTLSSKQSETSWSEIQMFRFGLMSYLLPRYLVMMGHSDSSMYDKFSQWLGNNELPCRFEDGAPYDSWSELNQDLMKSGDDSSNHNSWKVSLLPSQSITARWMANFEGILDCECNNRNDGYWLYGVKVDNNDDNRYYRNVSIHNPNPVLYSSGDSQGGEGSGSGSQYALDGITCSDGWRREFYYYSAPPYQSYRVWSAGPNGRTFPPWVSPEEMQNGVLGRNRSKIAQWVEDDIVSMKN